MQELMMVSMCGRVEETIWMATFSASPVSRAYAHERSATSHLDTSLLGYGPVNSIKDFPG